MAEHLAKLRRGWDQFWYAPIDAAPLTLFRQAFAWTLLIYTIAWSRSAGWNG